MCNYALDLATSVINLEFNKNKVLAKDRENKRLCHCRREILENYIAVAQMLYVRVTARTIKFLEDRSNAALTLETEDLKRWFTEHAYDRMFEDETISNKMVLLFKSLQTLMDDKFFEYFANKYSDIIMTKMEGEIDDDQFGILLADLYNAMLKWFETCIFNTLAIRIDCNSIKDEIFSARDVPEDGFCCNRFFHQPGCYACPDNRCTERAGCRNHIQTDESEDVMLYVIDEMRATDGWISNFIETIATFHKNPKNIKFTLNFKLYDIKNQFEFVKNDYDIISRASEVFGSVDIINSRGVDFGEWYPLIERYVR